MNVKCAHARGAAESSGYNDRIRMHDTLIMAKPRSVALKTAEDPGREGFAAEGSIGHVATGREQERTAVHVSKKAKKLKN
jgi:hypothetical protein